MTLTEMNSTASIDQNIKAHDKVSSRYDSKHVEIYNYTEQNRIKSILRKALSLIKTGAPHPLILDFGSGTGNLTKHLLDLQATVIAGDVSQKSLDYLIKKSNGHKHLTTAILNGKDLCEFSDNSFDMVTTYSVLHHVPDYLGIIDEFVRVTKPGGVIFIDHEVCPSYWEENDKYLCYLNELSDNFLTIYKLEISSPGTKFPEKQNYSNYFSWLNYRKLFQYAYNKLNRLIIIQPIIENEGDLHTSRNDHIEWHKIKNKLLPQCKIILQEDYLVCRERDSQPTVWNNWKESCVDMRLIIAQKQYGKL